MVGLSVRGDAPPNQIQPQLVDGIHLRWTFKREIGFPWYGYYLFRRVYGSRDCRIQDFDISSLSLQPGSTTADLAEGKITSDSTLVLTNFPPTGAVGLSLDGRSYLRFIPSEIASSIEARIGFLQDTEINATAFASESTTNPSGKKTQVAQASVRGQAGQVATVSPEFDAISAVEFSPGQAVLLELKFLAVSNGALAGWQPVPGFPYPMSMPIIHPDYPCNTGTPNLPAAEAMALGRITYGQTQEWSGINFANLHDQLLKLVDGGIGSAAPMAERFTPPQSPSSQPHMPKQYPLDLVLLGSLHPAVAQMMGLYWVDQQVDPNERYDYLIVAAHKNSLGSNATDARQRLLSLNGFEDVDAFIVFNKSLTDPAPPLDVPSAPRTYALPSGNIRPQTTSNTSLQQLENNAGLRWDLGVTNLGVLLPGKAIMYHIWRTANLGSGETPATPTNYVAITQSERRTYNSGRSSKAYRWQDSITAS